MDLGWGGFGVSVHLFIGCFSLEHLDSEMKVMWVLLC
jgi:hypothetical protein